MKSAAISNLIFFKALLILAIWELTSFINFFVFSEFTETVTCFLDGFFIVMFSLGFVLFLSLMIFWMFLIFLFCNLGNTSLILRVSLAVLEEKDKACAYDFFSLFSVFFLKNLEISLTSLEDLAGIRWERWEIEASLIEFLPFFELLSLFIWGLNWAFTLHLKEIFLLSAMRSSHPES